MSARECNIIVHMRFIPGSMNTIMDTLSMKNKLVPTKLSFCPNIIHQLTSIVEKPWIDLFATKQSYVSHVPDGRTYSVDALTTHWGDTWAYAYPPHALVPKILSKDYIVLLIAQLSFKLSGSKLCEAYQ